MLHSDLSKTQKAVLHNGVYHEPSIMEAKGYDPRLIRGVPIGFSDCWLSSVYGFTGQVSGGNMMRGRIRRLQSPNMCHCTSVPTQLPICQALLLPRGTGYHSKLCAVASARSKVPCLRHRCHSVLADPVEHLAKHSLDWLSIAGCPQLPLLGRKYLLLLSPPCSQMQS